MSTNPRLLKQPICIEHLTNYMDFYLIKMHVENWLQCKHNIG